MIHLLKANKSLLMATLMMLLLTSLIFSQTQGDISVKGETKDANGDLIAGVTIVLKKVDGQSITQVSNERGSYIFKNVLPGTYKITAQKEGFAVFNNNDLVVTEEKSQTLNIVLEIVVIERVEIGKEGNLDIDSNENATSLVLKGDDLNFLPDNPDDLASVLSALSGPTGPNGAQFLVDGFNNLGGRLPNRRQIEEIRINQNPFTAEYDQIGFGRVSIRLRPTTNEFHGEGEFYFSDESLNSRNPYSTNRPPFQQRTFFGALSGPLIKKKASFYIAAAKEAFDTNSIINAITLDSQNQPIAINRGIVKPDRELFSTFQVNYKATKNTDLVFNYQYLPNEFKSEGIGGFELESRGYDQTDTSHIFRLLGTTILDPSTVYQYRFQFIDNQNKTENSNTSPAIIVLDSFISGGADVGNSNTKTRRYELQNHITKSFGANTLRFGGRIRTIDIRDNTPQNFNGNFTFEGGNAPVLDENGDVVLGMDGMPVITQISSIERYRRTLVFQDQGLTPQEIRERGGGATQFGITVGSPLTEVNQFDVGVYAQYDWRISPSFNLGLGLRYENQTNISSNLNFAPRISFAWAPGASASNSPKSIIRGGFGVFYSRVPVGISYTARQFDGIQRETFITSDTDALDQFPNLPSVTLLDNSPENSTIRILSPDISSGYSYQAALSFERKLAKNTTFSVTYVAAKYLHVLRSLNINAPLPGTFDPDVPNSGMRPNPNLGNIYSFASNGTFNQQQIIFNVNSRINPKIFFYSKYTLNFSDSDTNGATNFPSSSFDLSDEFGRANNDIKHRFIIGATINAPYGFTLSPFISARSGIPFNITIGRDINGDTIFAERPSFAGSSNGADIIDTPFGRFNTAPGVGEAIIPLNFGTGPSFFVTNLRISKSFKVGKPKGEGKEKSRPYTITLTTSGQNIFNTTNPAIPIGNLSSPFFGRSITSATEAGSSSEINNRKLNFSFNFGF